MLRDDALFVGHALDAARRAVALTVASTREAFGQDEVLRLAVTHLLQTVGEAAGRVSDDLRRAHPEIPWGAAIGMRHRVVHDYFSIDDDIVWATATEDLPPLLPLLEAVLGSLRGE